MPRKNNVQLNQKGLERLLGQQTEVILDAVDKKVNAVDKKIENK